jgi:hypothetical protein
MAFEPKDYITQIKGKDYLETRFRILWFRHDHPLGSIQTERVSENPPIFVATIHTAEGHLLAQGHATAVDKGNQVWSGRAVEKAETAAIGRALGHAGYGTQFAVEGEPDEDNEANHLADSPQKAQPKTTQQQRQTTPTDTPVTFTAETGPAFVEWATGQFADLSPTGLNEALRHVVPQLEFIQQWPMSNQEAIAAIIAYQADYDRATLNQWFKNLKSNKVLKNRAGELFNDAQLDTFKQLAMKLAKGN